MSLFAPTIDLTKAPEPPEKPGHYHYRVEGGCWLVTVFPDPPESDGSTKPESKVQWEWVPDGEAP